MRNKQAMCTALVAGVVIIIWGGCAVHSAATATGDAGGSAVLHGNGILEVNGRHSVLLKPERSIPAGETVVAVGSVHSADLVEQPRLCRIRFSAQPGAVYQVGYIADPADRHSLPCRWTPMPRTFNYDIRNCTIATIVGPEGTEVGRCRLVAEAGGPRGGEEARPEPIVEMKTGEPAPGVETKTIHLVGSMPPEVWNRFGTKVISKLRSGADLTVGVDLSVTVNAANASNLVSELRQVLQELGLANAVKVE
jgi:hypothetical protein